MPSVDPGNPEFNYYTGRYALPVSIGDVSK